MIIAVATDAGGAVRAAVKDPVNLRQLHAEFRDVGDPAAAAALQEAGLGTVRDDHAWLSAAALRAAGDGGADWTQRFEALLGYAARQGWVSEDGTELQARIERIGDVR